MACLRSPPASGGTRWRSFSRTASFGQLLHEPLTQAPERVQGQGMGSNCQRQGSKLPKHFKAFDPAQR